MVTLRTIERRIGVVGLYESGKTVFLTSLLDHLKNQDPATFSLGPDGEALVRRFRLRPEAADGWARFPYEEYRDALVHRGGWPEKTTAQAQVACAFDRSDWRWCNASVRFYDLPGERIADAAMAVQSYAEWSDAVLARFRADTPYRQLAGDFLAAVEAEDVSAERVLAAYKLTLARLVLHYKPYVSPSTFLLDANGTVPEQADPEALADARLSGLAADSQFAPLPDNVRELVPELATTYAQHYAAYRKAVVLPTIRALRGCHALAVLVDIPMLLAGGTGMYDDCREILSDLIDVVDPGESFLGKLLKAPGRTLLPHAWRPARVNRLAFVASKMDRVHPCDRDNMLGLLRQMVRRPVRDLDHVEVLAKNCAAVLSAEPLDRDRRVMLGVPMHDAEGRPVPPGEPQRYAVSEVPVEWPRAWQPGAFGFPEVYPEIPRRKDCPPTHKNLDTIFEFLLG